MKIPPKFRLCAFFSAILFACALSYAQTPSAGADGPKFAYGGDAAEITGRFTDSLVFLSAHVNASSPSLFELDTTAAGSSIAPDRAQEIDRANVAAPVLNLDGVDVPIAALPAQANTNFGALVGLQYQGTLGRDFLANLVLQVDYARQTLRAYSAAHYKYSGKGAVLPLSQANGMPVIPIRFALEKGKEITADFIVDTALEASVVFDQKFLAAHHISGNDRGKTIPAIDPLSGAPNAAIGRLRTFEIGKNPLDDVLGVYSSQTLPDAGTPVAGVIGAGVLRRFTVVFDYPHHQLMLDPNINFPDPDQEDKSGLLIVATGPNYKTFEVVNVQAGTPASDVGIKKGDIIAGVDADPAADLSLLAVRDLFTAVGHKYKLLLQRQDKTIEVTIQMRRYL